MTKKGNSKWPPVMGGIVIVAGLLLAAAAWAGKPPAPNPPPPGKIYYRWAPADGSPELNRTMNPDGSQKVTVPDQYTRGMVASWARHPEGGPLWMVGRKVIPGEYYDEAHDFPRYELFAVREGDGLEVQLTDDPLVGQNEPIWASDGQTEDAVVSFAGGQMGDGTYADVYYYRLAVDWVADVPVPGTLTPYKFVGRSGPDSLVYAGPHDWSPDGSRLVYMRSSSCDEEGYCDPSSRPQLWIEAESGDMLLEDIVTGGVSWRRGATPDRILYKVFNDAYTIRPDGTDRQLVVPSPGCPRRSDYCVVTSLGWSPTGDYFLYQYYWSDIIHQDGNLYRCKADGSGCLDVTKDERTRFHYWVYGWRD